MRLHVPDTQYSLFTLDEAIRQSLSRLPGQRSRNRHHQSQESEIIGFEQLEMEFDIEKPLVDSDQGALLVMPQDIFHDVDPEDDVSDTFESDFKQIESFLLARRFTTNQIRRMSFAKLKSLGVPNELLQPFRFQWDREEMLDLFMTILDGSLNVLRCRGNKDNKADVLKWMFAPDYIGWARLPVQGGEERRVRLFSEDVPFTFQFCCRLIGSDRVRIQTDVESKMSERGIKIIQ